MFWTFFVERLAGSFPNQVNEELDSLDDKTCEKNPAEDERVILMRGT
jgi:hypothetical protein